MAPRLTTNSETASASGSTVCLLGAGRSGTTLLYKLLSLHREVGFLSNYQARFPRVPKVGLLQAMVRDAHDRKIASWFSAEGGAYFNTKRRHWIQTIFPTPAECEQVYSACGVPEYPASDKVDSVACSQLGKYFESTRRVQRTQVLLTKRTANNRRVAWLEEAFDRPKYLHIVRDGRAVAKSLLEVNWWGRNILSWRGKTVASLVSAGEDELGLAAECWTRELDNIDAGLRSIPKERILTLRYEDLLADYRPAMENIISFMGIDENSDSKFWHSLNTLGLRPPSDSWTKKWSAD